MAMLILLGVMLSVISTDALPTAGENSNNVAVIARSHAVGIGACMLSRPRTVTVHVN